MSDPQGKRWLADDQNFLASLNDLDRGLTGGGIADAEASDELMPVALPPPLPDPPPPADAPPSAALPAPTARARPAHTINAARALDPAHLLDTAPPSRPRRAVPAPPAAAVAPVQSEPDEHAPQPLTFTRSLPAEPRRHRPLLDLFPLSALEPDQPPTPALGTAVGPRLPLPRPRPAPRTDEEAPSPLDALTYETFYGLREKPFSLATDPKFQYQSAAHERAGQEMLAAIRKRTGPAVLTGLLGMGKTTLCRALVQEIDRRTITSLVLGPLQSIDDLLKTMLVDFGVMARGDLAAASHLTTGALTATLGSFLESLAPIHASAVVIIDEAQNLPVPLLAALSGILSGGGPAGRVLQVVLVGQPSLTSVLRHPDLRALNASVARRVELGALGADEVSSYVRHRLSIAGANTRIEFDDAAVARLFELSEGSPRVINLLCDRAMTRGQASSAGVIDGALIDAAAVDLDIAPREGGRRGTLSTLALALAFVLLVLVGAAAALFVSRDAVGRAVRQWQDIPNAPGSPVRRLPVPIAPIPPPAEEM